MKANPMTILTFAADQVATLITHAQSCSMFHQRWDGPADAPGLILVVGQGVYLISNGIDDTAPRLVAQADCPSQFTYASGINPYIDADWINKRRDAFREVTARFHTNIIDDAQVMIDRGCDTIRLATDGFTVRVFAQTRDDFAIGRTYKVASGLGGVFHVALKDVTDTRALVQNSGNCEDFDMIPAYWVTLDALQPREMRRTA